MNIEYIYRLPLNTNIEYEIINYHIAQPKWPGADGPLGLKALGTTASQPYLSGLGHRENSTYWMQRVRVSGTEGNPPEKFSNHIYILPKHWYNNSVINHYSISTLNLNTQSQPTDWRNTT